MPPKEPETLEERMYRVELLHEQHEKDFSVMGTQVKNVEALASEAKEMVTQTNTLVAQMPGEIMKSLKADSRGNRIEFRDWIIGLAVVAGPIIAVLLSKP